MLIDLALGETRFPMARGREAREKLLHPSQGSDDGLVLHSADAFCRSGSALRAARNECRKVVLYMYSLARHTKSRQCPCGPPDTNVVEEACGVSGFTSDRDKV